MIITVKLSPTPHECNVIHSKCLSSMYHRNRNLRPTLSRTYPRIVFLEPLRVQTAYAIGIDSKYDTRFRRVDFN